MKKLMTAELRNNAWVFIDKYYPNCPIQFDQAIMDVTHQEKSRVTGYVVSVHGIDQEIASRLALEMNQSLGVGGIPKLSVHKGKLLRLLPGGKVEKATFS